MKALQKKKEKAILSHSGASCCVASDLYFRRRAHTEYNHKAENTRKRSPIRLEGGERSRSICILIASELSFSHRLVLFSFLFFCFAERNAASFQMDCIASQVSFNFSRGSTAAAV